ncbi:MAG: iron-containing alcohol dehydrogenase [Firmicutes bacterium]|nr:iron-containing alcohol dehydrogenase [Bacillota bacterium]
METGFGILSRLGELVISCGGSRVFVVMDAFLARAPLNLHEKIEGIFKEAGMEFSLFSGYTGEPTTAHVNAALEVLKESQSDCVVAIGGGSAIDISKAVSLFAVNPKMKWADIAKQPRLKRFPLLAVPTTAGTGSEATQIMVITNTETNIKMNPGHPNLIPDLALLDPEMALSLPRNFTAFTGLDALAHAMEAYVSTRATVMTDLFAVESMRIIGTALPLAVEDGLNKDARRGMLLASCYAGIAFSNASTNLAHAAGRAMGAKYHIPHGLSIALLLPFVMLFGLDAAEERYANVAIALGANPGVGQRELAGAAVRIVEGYNDQFGIWNAAKNYIKDIQDFIKIIPAMVDDAMSGLKTNPTGNNGIVTNRKVPTPQNVAKVFELLAEKLS